MTTPERTPAAVPAVGIPLDRQVVPLVACPLCGGGGGYQRAEGSTFRWDALCCEDCGVAVAEARATPTVPRFGLRTERADAAWNAAGAYAANLRAVADEYNAWMRFHDAGEGDFADFLRKLVDSQGGTTEPRGDVAEALEAAFLDRQMRVSRKVNSGESTPLPTQQPWYRSFDKR
jgi:hypothetical protein